jgi:hypothetical protein
MGAEAGVSPRSNGPEDELRHSDPLVARSLGRFPAIAACRSLMILISRQLSYGSSLILGRCAKLSALSYQLSAPDFRADS